MGMFGAIIGFIIGVVLAILVAIFGFFGFILPGADTADQVFESEIAVESFVPAVVDPGWVDTEAAMNMDLVVVAFASAADFEAGHIPGAVRIDPSAIDIDSAEDTEWQYDLERLLGDSGISPETTVVVYDHGDMAASRFWWALSRLAHPAVTVLNGGIGAWEAAGLPVDMGEATDQPMPTIYYGWVDDARLATTADVEAALGDFSIAIIDARSAAEYAAGHIPGAINIPTEANFAPDGSLLPADELTALYADAGLDIDQPIIVYCATGNRATTTAMALASIGYVQVQVYAGSWTEWSSDSTRPVED
jgi:thiosulfate/3-mercaptopyruvate sulfurtransferase